MADVELRSLRVSMQMDAGQYAAGMAQKVAADKAGVASGQQAAAAINQVGTAASASVTKISQAGDVLQQLNRRYVDGYGAAQRFNSELLRLSGGIERGKITMQQAETILAGMAQRFGLMGDEAQFAARGQTEFAAAISRTNAGLREQNALAQGRGSGRVPIIPREQTFVPPWGRAQPGLPPDAANQNRFGSLNATSQFQDIAVTAAMGQNPMTIALQQGTQLGMAMQMMQKEGEGATGIIAGLGGAVKGLFTTTNLVAIGLTGAAALAIQYFTSGAEKSKLLDASLQDNVKSIKALTDAYHMAGVSVEDLQRKSIAASEADERRTEKELEAQIRLEQKRFTANTKPTDLMTFGMLGDNSVDVAPEFAAFTDPIRQLRKEIDAQAKGEGKANFDAFFQQIDQIANTGPGAFHGFVDELVRSTGIKVESYSDIRDRLYEMGGAARQAARQLELVIEVQRKIDQENTRQGLQDQRGLGRYVGTRNIQDDRESAQFQASQQMARARTNAERLAAVEAEARAKFPSQADEGGGRDARVERARQEEMQRQQMELKDAQDERTRSLDRTLASARLDVDLIGKTTAEVEGLRMAAQLEADVREQAAIKGVKADDAEIARIKAKAAEYGKLQAIQQARTIVSDQKDELELQRAEIGLAGESRLAHDRVIEALKTEQEIRKLGIPLYGQEAEAMRASTAASAANAEALAHATMQADLLFERSQILRNSTDQAIASAQHSAGLPVDLNSAEANMMRYNMALQETKDTFKGFASDMLQDLRDGKSLWDSFADAAVNALGKIADKLIDQGLDGIFGSIFGGQGAGGGTLASLLSGNSGQSGSSAGGASSILGNLFGGRGQSVASMQVQAASVFINGASVGSVAGGLGSLLGGQSGFQANTTLTDYLTGGGAANQNTIQTRIDQAFGTGGSAQDLIQSRIDQAFGTTSGGLGGIFSPAGGLTGGMSSYASAIKMIESAGSGGYSALGPVLKNGDQALGAYQVMRSNLPSWSTEAFGKPMSQGAFMSNPAAQDAIFSQQFGKSLSKYGNPSDAASVWFTGGPLSSGAGKSDVLGTTGSKYVDMFNDNLKKLGGTASQATNALGGLGSASQGLISQFSQMGQSLMGSLTPATSSSSWFQGLSGMFGGSSGALGFMNSVSPAATADILSGSWGLFANGAAFRHGNVVPFASGDVVSRPTYFPMSGGRTGMMGEAGDEAIMPLRRGPDGKLGVAAHKPANDRPAQNIHQTNNFIFRENPAAPSSQNQIAQKSAKALERLTRVS